MRTRGDPRHVDWAFSMVYVIQSHKGVNSSSSFLFCSQSNLRKSWFVIKRDVIIVKSVKPVRSVLTLSFKSFSCDWFEMRATTSTGVFSNAKVEFLVTKLDVYMNQSSNPTFHLSLKCIGAEYVSYLLFMWLFMQISHLMSFARFLVLFLCDIHVTCRPCTGCR